MFELLFEKFAEKIELTEEEKKLSGVFLFRKNYAENNTAAEVMYANT
jgi:hypothetical protein